MIQGFASRFTGVLLAFSLLLVGCAPKDKQLTSQGKSFSGRSTGDQALGVDKPILVAKMAAFSLIEVRRLIEDALSAKANVSGCRTAKEVQTDNANLDQTLVYFSKCSEATEVTKGMKEGYEVFYRIFANGVEHSSLPQSIVIESQGMNFRLNTGYKFKDSANINSSSFINAKIVGEDQTTVTYEAFANLVVFYRVDLYTDRHSGDYRTELLAIRFVVDKATKKIIAMVDGQKSQERAGKIVFSIGGEHLAKQAGVILGGRGQGFGAKVELQQLQGVLGEYAGSSCEAPKVSFKFTHDGIDEQLDVSANQLTLGEDKVSISSCSDQGQSGQGQGANRFLFLFESLLH
jgi:hypothetical protein